MYKRRTLTSIIVALAFAVLITTGCSPEPSKSNPPKEEEPSQEEQQQSSLGEIGHLNVSRHIDTAYTYGLSVSAGGVLGATRYYLYCGKTDDPNTASIIVDSETNSLSTTLNRHATSGTYYFWYRAGNGTEYTDFSNRVSVSF